MNTGTVAREAPWTANDSLGAQLFAQLTPEEWNARVSTTILFTVFGAWGIILNALPIVLTFCTEMRKNKVNVMVANLSTADLLFSVTFVFGQTQYILFRESISYTGCRWLGVCTFTVAFLEFMCPPMLSVNRYISLYYNQYYERIYKGRNIALLIVGTWIFCTIVPFIFMWNGKTGWDDDNMHCCIVVKYSPIIWTIFYWGVIIVPLIFFCDGTMMFCNFKIWKKLAEHNAAQTLKNNVMRQNKELLYFLIADMTFPILFHTTYHVAKFISVNRADLVQKRTFTVLYLINACVRGVVTLTMLRPYRRAMKQVLRCACLKSGSNVVAPLPTVTGHHTNHTGTRAPADDDY